MAKDRLKIIALLCLITVSGVMIAACSYRSGYWRMNNPSLEQFPIQGLDVSHHRGEIRWNEISRERFQFVYMKATEGGDFKDKRFVENWGNAAAAGFKVGAYHFFTFCRTGADQAENFIEMVPFDDNALPPVIDLEYVGNCSKRPSKETFAGELEHYITQIQGRYKKQPVLYTTYAFFEDYLAGSKYAEYPIWIRDVWGRPDSERFQHMRMWQYADNARVNGIETPVDVNVMYD